VTAGPEGGRLGCWLFAVGEVAFFGALVSSREVERLPGGLYVAAGPHLVKYPKSDSMSSITVTFPKTATLPAELRDDPERARYLIVGGLYQQGRISRREAAALTGDAEVEFVSKLERYGFQASGRADTQATSSGEPKTRWQALAERLDQEGFLDGRSEEAEDLLAECRLTF
jgi:hypothetical protein